MILTPKSRRALQAALLAAVPDRASLYRLAASVFTGIPAPVCEQSADLALAVGVVLSWAEDHDRVIELVCAVQKDYPTSESLRRANIELMAPLPPLPPGDPDFIGRETDLVEVCQMVQATAATGGTVILVGPAGIGKTQLALATAQQLQTTFPDGQVWVDLRGSATFPLSTEYALALVMHAFYPQLQLPARPESLESIYRGYVLQGTQTLILADDASDAAQVAALRPPPGCVLLVTSRVPLAVPHSQHYQLDPLPAPVAARLFQATAPDSRWDAPRLAQLAEGSPLALYLLAAERQAHPDRPLGDYRGAIHSAQRATAAAFAPEGGQIAVGVLTLLWETLPLPERLALGQLSLFVAEFDRAAAEAVLDPPLDATVASLLRRLQQWHLLQYNAATGRYQVPALIQALAGQYLDAAAVYAAQLRYAQHYLAVVQQVAQLFQQAEDCTAAGDYGATLDLLRAGCQRFSREQPHLDAVEAWLLLAVNGIRVLDRLLLDYLAALTPLRARRFAKRPAFIPGWLAWLAAADRLGDAAAAQTARAYLGQRYLQPPPAAPPASVAAVPPRAFLPAAFGWIWGRSQPADPADWPVAPSDCTAGFARLTLPIGGQERDLEVFFGDPRRPELHQCYDARGRAYDWSAGAPGLFCIRTCLRSSQLFFEEDLDGEAVSDVLARVGEEYTKYYTQLVAHYTAILGAPAFSGSRYISKDATADAAYDHAWVDNPAYPADQWESPLTSWIHPAGRFQLGLHQEDKELPIQIWVSWFAPAPDPVASQA